MLEILRAHEICLGNNAKFMERTENSQESTDYLKVTEISHMGEWLKIYENP